MNCKLLTLILSVSLLIISILAIAQPSSIVKNEFIFTEAPFKECHASTIVSTPQGLVAAWFGGTQERNKDVEIWISREKNNKWSNPESVADGIQSNNERLPTWNPVLFQMPEGPLLLFYKVGPSPSEWWGMLKTSTDNGKSWSTATRLSDGILGPIKNKPVLIDNRLLCPSSSEHDGWRIHFEITTDMGKTWKVIGPINTADQFNAIQPSILTYGKDTLQILARSKEDKLVSSWSYDRGNTWGKLYATELPNPNSGTDAVTLSNGYQLLVYNPTTRDTKNIGNSRTPLAVAVSKDGITWKTILTLEKDPGEYSYPAVIQTKDGIIQITYTWKRERIKHVSIDPTKIDF